MTRTLARIVAIGALVVALGSLAFAVLVEATHEEVPPGRIVVVGDRSTPGVQDVVHELQVRADHGDDLRASGGFDPDDLVITILVFLWIGVGAVIVWRQPGNWAGWVFVITGSTVPVSLIATAVVIANLKSNGSLPLTGLFAWAGEFALYPIALLPLLFLLYPDGHPPSPRWRWSVVGLVGGTFLAFLGFLVRPGPYNNWRDDGIVYANPFGIDGFTVAGFLIASGTTIALLATISTAVAVVVRFRRSSGEERQQMRVLALVAAVAGVSLVMTIAFAIVASVVGFDEEGTSPIFTILWSISLLSAFLGIPVAYLVAIFKHGLWNLDVVIKKTLVALVLTLIIGAVALVVLGLSTQIAWLLPGPLPFFWLIGVGVMALPFLRLARRLARRVVFGRRATLQEVLTAFGERVGESYSVVDVLPRMVQILANGTGATSARVLLRLGGELREEAVVGDPLGDPLGEEYIVAVTYEGEELGALTATFPPNDPIDATKMGLMQKLADQAALALRNVKLIEELRASRQRLVAAQDEERRRLERNIHDGAQQQLVALQVQQRLAEQLVERDPAKARELLTRLQQDAATALDDLRDLARGIYPPLLADQGLPAALDAQARRAAVPTSLYADGVERYPQEVEAAVYFCALEALNNVAKYAQASAATVRLAQHNGHLTFTVSDDGRGFDLETTGYGTGLQGMADRLDAIDGTLRIESRPGAGTSVTGSVPAGEGAIA